MKHINFIDLLVKFFRKKWFNTPRPKFLDTPKKYTTIVFIKIDF